MSYSVGPKYEYPQSKSGHSYDNKAYAGSRGQVYNDSQYAEHPDFSRKQKSGRGKCIAIGLVCFVLLAAAIAVGIYFGVRSKSDDDEPEVATTVQTTLILDENWDPNLENPTSAAYIAKKKEVEDGIDVLMEGVDGYKDSTVVGFFQGSIGADTKIEMTKNTIPDQAGVKKAITADRMKDFLKRKVASAKAKNNAFASKIMADKIDASPQTGAIGNTDLGYACSKNTDCEDKNTECTGTTKVCTCKSGFFNKRDKGGLCSISKAYGAMCTMNKECALPKMMCSSSKCACKTETHWKNQQCMDNIDIDRAGCTADDECKSGATCVQGTCRCPAEKMKKNNMCTEKVDINQQGCTADEDCKAGKCVSTYCRCPEDTVYDKGDCKDKSDTGKYCSGENLEGAIYRNCNEAWESHQSKGEQRHLVQFVGCMWFHAYTIKRENCDIDNLLKELSKSRLNKAGRIMQLTNEDREALAKMAREVQSPSDLCNQPMPVRYIAEHSCFKVAPSFTDDEKCVVRLFAKGCVRHTMMSSGVNCTVAQINTMFNHDFVKTGLMDNFPTTTCENSFTACESKFIRGSISKFPCLGFLGEASLYTKYKSNLPSIGSSDGTHQLTCSLWRGVHKCMKSYTDSLQCSPEDVNRVAAIFSKAVIKVVRYEAVKGDPKLGTVDDFTVTDFSQNCDVSDVTAPADSCPSKSFMADTVFVICAVQVEYTKKMHPDIDNCVIPIKDCMHEKMESLYEAFGCRANPEDSLPALLMEKSNWLTQMFEFNVQECMDVAQCVKKMREHEYQGCMDFQGLVMQDHNLKDQDEVCASVDVVTDHLIPACIKKYDDIDSKCEQLAKKIWMRVYSEVKTYLNRTTTRFENCAAHSVGTCAAQSIKTLFKCYGLYFRSEGECRTVQCITSTTTPQGCSTTFDPIDVLQRAEIIYGKQPECEIQDCGVGIFPQAAGSMCKLGWLKWKSESNSAEKCRIYQSFLGCTAFNLLIRGEQICGFATLHQNIVATASKFGYNPTICTSSSFQQMDNQFAKTRAEVCRNDFIYRSILSDYTPLPVGLFAGNTERNQCMREVAKKVELYTIFLTSGLIECTNQIVWEHAATEAVRKDIFDLSSGCENNYNCTVLTLSYGEALTHCSTFMTNTLFLSSIFDVDTENAFETDAESLKCRAFNMATGCVVNILKDCMGNIADVQDGLRILANSGTINSPYAVKKADIFNSCPSYSISEVSACPPANYLPDMVTVYCTIEPAFAIRSGASMKDACDAVWKCIEGVVGSVKDCPGIPEAAVELMSPTTLDKFEKRSGLACKPYAVASYCASKLYQHDECSSLAGLVMIENKLMSRNEKCASVHLILKELLPNCVKNHGLPAECSEHIPGIWHEMLEHAMEEAGIVETMLDKCDDYVVNKCEAQEITTLFRCYGNHFVKDGGCSTIGCIEAATSSCPSKPLNKIAVYKWAHMIYGDLPECQLPACGEGVFNMMAAGGCAPAWNAWVAGTTTTDKCQAYKAFLGCIAFSYRAYSADFCDFQQLHSNIVSEAKKTYSQEPTLCNGETPAMLDALFPQTSAEVCSNPYVITSMLNFFCPSSITAFTGTEEKKKCLDEMKRTKCLIDSIQDSFKDCKTETIKAAVNTQAIRTGIFDLQPGCDNTYPCIKAAIMKPDMAACSQLLVNLLLMTKYGVEVSTATAMDSTDKLKCKFWEIATGCALTVVPECQNKAMEAQDALKIMTTYHLMEYPKMAVHVDTFDECPAFPSTFSPCPDGEYYVYSVIGYCGLSAVDMFRNGYHPDIACSSMLSCSGLITASLSYCPGITETAKTLTTDKSRAYIGDLTTLSCPRPGECPALKDDSFGTCDELCSDDTGCPNMQKCCFNGCGHTCQEPRD